jgi:hypothetical protein
MYESFFSKRKMYAHPRIIPNNTLVTPRPISSVDSNFKNTQNFNGNNKNRSIRTHKNIPEHVKKNIESLYNSMQYSFGNDERIRKRNILVMMKIYYKWEKYETFLSYFDLLIKNKEKHFLLEQQSKKIEDNYSKKVLKLFGCIDDNGDSGIDLKEFKSAVDFLDIDTEKIFEDGDKDKNGVLDAIEFYNIIAKTPILLNNFDCILERYEKENERKNMIKRSSLFSYNCMSQRPCLANIKKKSEILQSDIPIYNVSIRHGACDAHKRYFGHKEFTQISF